MCTKELVFHLRACFRTFHTTTFSFVGLFYCFFFIKQIKLTNSTIGDLGMIFNKYQIEKNLR